MVLRFVYRGSVTYGRPVRKWGPQIWSQVGLRGFASRLNPAVLERLGELQKEHEQLSLEMSENYNEQSAARIGRLQPVIDLHAQLAEGETQLHELQELFADPQLAEEAKQEHKELNEDLGKLSIALQKLMTPTSEFLDKPCLLEIRPGIGGSEAALFAADLLSMYQNYALKHKWATSLVSSVRSPNGGVTEAILHIKDSQAYERLQYEGGVHRVQRVPETETKGRVHTSTAAVVVLPDLSGDASPEEAERAFAHGELRIDVMRASGSGGQHVNTTESAVRIVHIPTGMVVTCQDERSQHKNKARALMVLRGRLAEKERQEKAEDDRNKRSAQVTSTERSDKIRTYNYPQNRITDHRCNYSLHNLDEVLAGDRLDDVIDAMDDFAKTKALTGM